MIKALVAALCVIGLAAPAAAETQTSSKRVKSDKVQRCVTHHEIGTRLAKKRVCMSEKEWRQLQQETRRDLDQTLGQKPSYLE